MPSITGFITEEQKRFIEEKMVENGRFDDSSEALQHLIGFTLYNKYGYTSDSQ